MLLSSGLDVAQTLFASQGIGKREAHHLFAFLKTDGVDGSISSKIILDYTQPYDAGGTAFKFPPPGLTSSSFFISWCSYESDADGIAFMMTSCSSIFLFPHAESSLKLLMLRALRQGGFGWIGCWGCKRLRGYL